MYAFFNQLAITIKHLPYLIHKTTHTPPPIDKARPQSITLSLLSLFISSLETLALLVCRMHEEALLRTHHTYIGKKKLKELEEFSCHVFGSLELLRMGDGKCNPGIQMFVIGTE